jgi:chromosome segregation ATPase
MSGTRPPEEIQEEIEETRAELGDTVEALAHKTDVKAQAKAKVSEAKATVSEKADEFVGKAQQASPDAAVSVASGAARKARENPAPLAAGAIFGIGFLLGRLTRR